MSSYKIQITLASILFHAFLVVNSSKLQLSTDFYNGSCPNLLSIVKSKVEAAIANEKRMGASLLRLHFHDCFVNGCDGSVLLPQELIAAPNNNSLRGMKVIDIIKDAVEADSKCRNKVSCADILAIAARDSVVALGGNYWDVKLGRKDAKTASTQAANNKIPSAFSNLTQLIKDFTDLGLDEKDLVVLSGAHTIGNAKCSSFKGRIYNETSSIDAAFAGERQSKCPKDSSREDDTTAPLDILSPVKFDNKYFKNLVNAEGLLHTDQQLLSNKTSGIYWMVKYYANNEVAFLTDFTTSMIKMSEINPLLGEEQGEIRTNCAKPNK